MFWTIVILVILYILNIIDYLETMYLVHYFGIAAEANPIMRVLIEYDCAWFVKLIIIPIILIYIGIIIQETKCSIWPIAIVTFFFFLVIIHNLCMIEMAGLMPEINSFFEAISNYAH